MNEVDSAVDAGLSIRAVERETGLSKDVLRKWEQRYGFPSPLRDKAGERVYPAGQVARLCMIKRLLDTGLRPARVVPQDLDALTQLAGRLARPDAPARDGAEDELMQILRRHEAPRLRQALERCLFREGLTAFVQDRLTGLMRQVGEAWARGELDIHEEHLFSEVVQGIMREVAVRLDDPQGHPRVLFTTVPGEPHGLGLHMVAALAALEGAHSLVLGTQMPIQEIVRAARVRKMDVVGVSFSSHYPARQVLPSLDMLRDALPAACEIWVGGEGAKRLVRTAKGVRRVVNLAEVRDVIAAWRGAGGNDAVADGAVAP